jgi:ComF family protein
MLTARLQRFQCEVILSASARLELLLPVPRVRSVFSVGMKVVQLGNAGPPGSHSGAGRWRTITRILPQILQTCETTLADVTHVFLPSDCRLCGAPMVSLGNVRVCAPCIARATAQQDILCTRCGDALGMESARFAVGMGVTECTMCRLAPPEFAKAVAFANYDHEMREMLHLLKFGGKQQMAEHVLGERMAAAILKLRGLTNDDLLVIPVPLFAARERERGFNQSRLLAETAVKRLRKLAPTWRLTLNTTAMQRIKNTRALYTLNPAQRRRNLKGAFRIVDQQAVTGREVLLVDDIMTTGATARECSRILLRAGATKVWVATAAKAQPESVSNAVQHDVATWDAVTTTKEPDITRRMSF